MDVPIQSINGMASDDTASIINHLYPLKFIGNNPNFLYGLNFFKLIFKINIVENNIETSKPILNN